VIFWGAPSQLIALPPMNLAPTEILEVAVISSAGATPYHTCTGSVGFYAADGNPIGAPVHFTVDDGLAIHSAEISGKDAILTARPHAVSAEISLTADPITIAYRGQTPPCVVTFSARTMDATTGDVHSSVGGQSTGTTQPIGASPTSLTRNPAHRH